MTLPELVKSRRLALGLSQQELAEVAGVDTDTVIKFEQGLDIGDISILSLVALAAALDVPAWRLVELMDQRQTTSIYETEN